jgi:hypothetical protein
VDYTEAMDDLPVGEELRSSALINRAQSFDDLALHDMAIQDLDEALSAGSLSDHSAALALVSSAVTHSRRDQFEDAIADYDRILGLRYGPAEARCVALYNRGVCTLA